DAVVRKIRLDDRDIRVQSPQQGGVGRVLVDCDDLAVPARFEARDEILPDEAGGAGDGDLCGHGSNLQAPEHEPWQCADHRHDRPPEPRAIDDAPPAPDGALHVRGYTLRRTP